MKNKETPIVKIRPDVEYMPPENYEPPELKIVIKDEANRTYCAHEYIKIYPHHRIIQCAECSATLDAFDHLVAVGRREGNELSSLKYLKHQVKRLQDEEEALKKEITKLRAEKKKLNKP